jgi:hypothetical protein
MLSSNNGVQIVVVDNHRKLLEETIQEKTDTVNQ